MRRELFVHVPKDEDCEHGRPQPVAPGWGLSVFDRATSSSPHVILLRVDTVPAAMLPEADQEPSDFVTPIRRPFSFRALRNWRGLLAMLVATMYLLSGVLHGAHDIDVTSPSGGSEIAMMLDNGSTGHGDHKAIGGHHCHGCFSIAVAQPLLANIGTDLVTATPVPHHPALSGIAPDTDSPPPKHLT